MVLYFACVNCGHRWTDEDEANAAAERQRQSEADAAAAAQEEETEEQKVEPPPVDQPNSRTGFQFHTGNTQSLPAFEHDDDDAFGNAVEGHEIDDADDLFHEESGDVSLDHHPEEIMMDEDF